MTEAPKPIGLVRLIGPVARDRMDLDALAILAQLGHVLTGGQFGSPRDNPRFCRGQ